MLSIVSLKAVKLRYFLFFTTILIGFAVKSQTFNWAGEFAKAVPGEEFYNSYVSYHETDDYGNTYLVGTFQGVGDFDPGEDVHLLYAPLDVGIIRSMFIMKMNTEGELVWVKMVGYPDGELAAFHDLFPFDMSIGVSGNEIYIAGHFQGAPDFNVNAGEDIHVSDDTDTDGYDIFLMKLDSEGNYFWTKTWDGNNYESLSGVETTTGGDVLISGVYRGEMDLNPNEEELIIPTFGGHDAFLIRLSAFGEFISGMKMGGTGTSGIQNMKVTDTDEIILAGYFSELVDFDMDPAFGETLFYTGEEEPGDAFLMKLNTAMEIDWINQFPVTGSLSSFEGITLDTEGNIYCIGGVNGTMDVDPSAAEVLISTGVKQGIITRYASDGTFQWVNHYEGTAVTVMSGIVFVNDEVIVSGSAWNGTYDLDPGPGEFWNETEEASCGEGGEINRDIFFSRLAPDGTFIYAHGTDGAYCESSSDLSTDLEGNYYLSGQVLGTVDLDFSWDGEYVMEAFGSGANYLVKMSACEPTEHLIIEYSCGPYISPSGAVYLESGVYVDTLLNEYKCDSLLTIYLTVADAFVAEITLEGIEYTAYPDGAEYQWVDCDDDYAWIIGATEQSFIPEFPGNYAAIVTSAGCQDTTACLLLEDSGINASESPIHFRCFPNPAANQLTILTNMPGQLIIYNALGERIQQQQIIGTSTPLDLSNYANGSYYLSFETLEGDVQKEKFQVMH